MNEYTITWNDITTRMKPLSVHVRNDEHLLAYLRAPGKGALALAEYLLAQYEARYGAPLDISAHSLAIEILGHVFADQFAEAVSSLLDKVAPDADGPLSRLLEKVQERSEEIDCGEASIDSNRFVWDMLVPFHGLIYAIADR